MAVSFEPFERHELFGILQDCKCEGLVRMVNRCGKTFVLIGRKKGDRGVSEGRKDVREVFQQCGSGAKRKLSRCGRNQMGNEPILALPEGADDFVVYYDARSKDLEACLEKGEEALSERDMRVSYMDHELEVEYQGSSRLLLQPVLPEWKWERITKDIVVKLPSVSGGYDATWV
ncbi:hypothetical protein Tco_0066482 [Tanacetum coccineum]